MATQCWWRSMPNDFTSLPIPYFRLGDLPDIGAVTDNSSVVGEHAGTGRFSAPALANDVQNADPDLSLKWYATGDGTTDDTTAVQPAVNAAIAAGRRLIVPGGTFLISSTVTVNGALTMLGSGDNARFAAASAALTMLSVTTPAPCTFENLKFGSLTAPFQTAGATLNVDPGAGAVSQYVTIRNCQFWHQNLAIAFEHAAMWTIVGCWFEDNTNCISIANTGNIDFGDSSVMGCVFSQWGPNMPGGVAIGSCVHHHSAGGMRFIGNKVLQHQWGYLLDLNLAGGATADLMIVGNSFENQTSASIACQQGAGNTDIFKNLSIIGNQFFGTPRAIYIIAGTGANWLQHFAISGNITEATSGTGPIIEVATGSHGVIAGNVLTSDGGTETGIKTAAAVTNTVIACDNRFSGTTTNVDAGASTLVETVTVGGADSRTTSTAYGSLFEGSGAAITFPGAPFAAAPSVACVPT